MKLIVKYQSTHMVVVIVLGVVEVVKFTEKHDKKQETDI